MNTQTKSFTTDQYVVNYPVQPNEHGLRLDAFLKSKWETLSREFLKKKIESGEVIILGRPTPHRSSTKVHAGETVTIYTYKSAYEDEFWKGEKIGLKLTPEIIFEDEEVLIISKPAFMSTHPAGKHLFNCATVVFQIKYNQTIHSAHRLDRETSGILVLAKDPIITSKIQQQFEHHQVQKCYFLIAHNLKKLSEKDFPITALENLAKGEELSAELKLVARLSMHCFPAGDKNGKHAETTFHWVTGNDQFMVLLAFPKTGRQHQIRAHAAFHGFPLLGDKIYRGNPEEDGTLFARFKDGVETKEDYELLQIPRHALHSIAIQFEYKKQKKLFLDKVPEDLSEWLNTHLKINEKLLMESIKSKF